LLSKTEQSDCASYFEKQNISVHEISLACKKYTPFCSKVIFVWQVNKDSMIVKKSAKAS